MQHRILPRFLVFVSLLGTLFSPALGRAAETFNPNFIITDEQLQDWQSMGRGEIQAFLQNKSSFLADFVTFDVNGKERRATDIIYNASREHRISPQYLLVKLQKEQSLVEEKNLPTNSRRIDYATGYAVCDSCSFSDPQVVKYKGFGKQVDAAAGIMRWYYDNVGSSGYVKKANTTYTIDGTNVTPANLATAFLYTYTPHLQGNKNFWKLWQSWFEQVYPNGTLLKATDDSQIYVLQDGKKRLIKSMAALVTRYNPNAIIEVPASEIARYQTGPEVSFPNYSILQEGERFYLVDFDELRPFENKTVVQKLGYHPDEYIPVTSADIAHFSLGTTITLADQFPSGRLLRVGDKQQLYFVKDGVYRPLFHKDIAKMRFPQLIIESGRVDELANLTKGKPMTFPNGTLMGDTDSGNVYVIEDEKKRHISSETVFNGLGYKWDNVLWVDTFTSILHDTGEPIYLRGDAQVAAEENTAEQEPEAKKTTTPAPSTTITQTSTQWLGKLGSGTEVMFFKQSPNDKLPLALPETGKMIATPSADTRYDGPHFTTDIDSYLVADYTSGTILAGKNIDQVRLLASFSKVMTALELVRNNVSFSESTGYQAARHRSAYHTYSVAEGDRIKNSDLFNEMLARSRNTPARMLASNIAGGEARFISGMNAKAATWGLDRIHFADSYGYSMRNQGSARQFLRVFTEALKNNTIKSALALDEFSYEEVSSNDEITTHSGKHSNPMVRSDYPRYEVVASKTGFLNESGFNTASLIRRKSDNKEFIVITMGNPNWSKRISETERLVEWTVDQF